jgi:hypothetical protein
MGRCHAAAGLAWPCQTVLQRLFKSCFIPEASISFSLGVFGAAVAVHTAPSGASRCSGVTVTIALADGLL